MATWRLIKRVGGWLAAGLVLAVLAGQGTAAQGTFADTAFQKVWERSDKPVKDGRAGPRSWMWGPEARQAQREPYRRNVFGGDRLVQYFDKARMEINDPNGDRNNLYFVTNGRLVVELVSGRVQIGDDSYDNRLAAEVPVSGDNTAANKDAPAYATLYKVANIGGAGSPGTQVAGGLKFYPNPVQSTLSIELPDQRSGFVNAELINTSGQKVLAFQKIALQNGKLQIPVGKLAAGVYQVVVSGNGKVRQLSVFKP